MKHCNENRWELSQIKGSFGGWNLCGHTYVILWYVDQYLAISVDVECIGHHQFSNYDYFSPIVWLQFGLYEEIAHLDHLNAV